MANDIRKNVSKGVESFIITTISAVIAEAVCKIATRYGFAIDNAEVKLMIVAILTGAGHWIQNWITHRDVKPAAPVAPKAA